MPRTSFNHQERVVCGSMTNFLSQVFVKYDRCCTLKIEICFLNCTKCIYVCMYV